MDAGLLRILDAAANRAREALRVLEDVTRFSLNDREQTEQLKRLRHDLASALTNLPMGRALEHRDTPGDVGTGIKTDTEFSRGSLEDLLAANAKRLSEALRSLEECAKMINSEAAAEMEKIRYRSYALEQIMLERAALAGGRERFSRVRLCVLLTESVCAPRRWEEVLLDILNAMPSEKRGSLCVQLREKSLADAELLNRARILVRQCRKVGAVSIINDRADIALLSEADGVHLGQSDLPCVEARRLLGSESIVGISTGKLEEARRAIADGATYIAAGPMFHSTTKEKLQVAGPAYAAETLALNCPVVAIGGITLENIGELIRMGVERVAVSAAVVRCAQPGQMAAQFLNVLGELSAVR
jgi:thiamine-phosphate pyrophosphorylase